MNEEEQYFQQPWLVSIPGEKQSLSPVLAPGPGSPWLWAIAWAVEKPQGGSAALPWGHVRWEWAQLTRGVWFSQKHELGIGRNNKREVDWRKELTVHFLGIFLEFVNSEMNCEWIVLQVRSPLMWVFNGDLSIRKWTEITQTFYEAIH